MSVTKHGYGTHLFSNRIRTRLIVTKGSRSHVRIHSDHNYDEWDHPNMILALLASWSPFCLTSKQCLKSADNIVTQQSDIRRVVTSARYHITLVVDPWLTLDTDTFKLSDNTDQQLFLNRRTPSHQTLWVAVDHTRDE